MATHLDYRDRDWSPQPAPEAALRRWLDEALTLNRAAAQWRTRLLAETGVRFRDLVDHVTFAGEDSRVNLEAEGWRQAEPGVWRNAAGLFPPHVRGAEDAIWLRVESADAFLAANGLAAPVEGAQFEPLRRAIAFPGEGVAVGIVERSGGAGFAPEPVEACEIRAARIHLQCFRARRREFDTVDQGLDHAERLVHAAVGEIGPHRACDLWLKAEREYWMRRCPPGARQKARQDALGIGWANIDHHTYDGSRQYFRRTIGILETLGYELREMLYAGDLAGWGSQVLEQPVIGSTIFADVDLAPHELEIDFAHAELPPLDRHRRAGILSVLHGESILEGGLNHVAALYDQAALRAQLAREGIGMMKPFSSFPFLYQELTEGIPAPVDPARIDRLERAGHLTAAEAEDIRLNGYIATHLENIERNDGYKGFNKPGIDGVLRALDPRAAVRATAV
jgi:hypothetical protein